MSRPDTLRLYPRLLLCAILGAGLLQVIFTLWAGRVNGLLLIGALIGLLVGDLHWRSTVKHLDGDVVKSAVAVFRLDVLVPGLFLLVYSAGLSFLMATGRTVYFAQVYIVLQLTVTLFVYLGFLHLAYKFSEMLSASARQAPPPPLASEPLVLSLLFILCISILDQFREFVTTLVLLIAFLAVGTWLLTYSIRIWLYERRNSPLYLTRKQQGLIGPLTRSFFNLLRWRYEWGDRWKPPSPAAGPGPSRAGDSVRHPGFKAKYKTKTHATQPARAGAASQESPPATLDLTPYAGRWVALLHGEVAGVGATADDARLAAQLQYGEQEPTVVWVPDRSTVESEG